MMKMKQLGQKDKLQCNHVEMHHASQNRENGQQNPICIKYGALIMKTASESNKDRSGVLISKLRFLTENVWIFTKNTSLMIDQEHRQHKAAIIIIFSLEKVNVYKI